MTIDEMIEHEERVEATLREMGFQSIDELTQRLALLRLVRAVDELVQAPADVEAQLEAGMKLREAREAVAAALSESKT